MTRYTNRTQSKASWIVKDQMQSVSCPWPSVNHSPGRDYIGMHLQVLTAGLGALSSILNAIFAMQTSRIPSHSAAEPVLNAAHTPPECSSTPCAGPAPKGCPRRLFFLKQAREEAAHQAREEAARQAREEAAPQAREEDAPQVKDEDAGLTIRI